MVIGVVMGGNSSEREISLKSGKAVAQALKAEGAKVKEIVLEDCIPSSVKAILEAANVDVVFIALHGRFGEDGGIQAILEEEGIPYTGSGVEASRLAIDKAAAQEIFISQNIPVPKFATLHKGEFFDNEGPLGMLSWPLVVKPAREGSSIGITLVEKEKEFRMALDQAFRYDETVLVEEYIKGRELTVGVLDGEPLPIVEIKPKHKFFDFVAKYEKGQTEYIVPAVLPSSITQKVEEAGVRAYEVLGCRHFARTDIILDEQNQPFVLEVNTIPGFTATSLLPKAAAAKGINFSRLCLKLAELAYGTKKNTIKK